MTATAASTTSYGLGAETNSDEDHGLIGNSGARGSRYRGSQQGRTVGDDGSAHGPARPL